MKKFTRCVDVCRRENLSSSNYARLNLKEKVERLPASMRLVDHARIKMLDEPTIVAAGDDEFMALPVHRTGDSGACGRDAFHVRAIGTTTRAAVGASKSSIKSFVPFIANVSGGTTPRWSRDGTNSVVAAMTTVALAIDIRFAGRALHDRYFLGKLLNAQEAILLRQRSQDLNATSPTHSTKKGPAEADPFLVVILVAKRT